MTFGRFGWPALFLAPAVLVFVGFFLVPQAELVRLAFDKPPPFGIANYQRFFGDPYYLELLGRSVMLGVSVTLVTLILGFPLAYLLARLESRIVPLLLLIVTFPLWVSALVRSFAWMVLFFKTGLVSRALQATGLVDSDFQLMYTFAGMVVALSQVLLPVMVLTLYPVLRGIDRDLENAAMNLGAGPFTTLALVTVRLARGGIVAGSLLVFSLAMSSFATPSLIGGARVRVLSVAIYEQTLELLDWPFAAAMASILLVVAVAIVLVYGRLGAERAPAA